MQKPKGLDTGEEEEEEVLPFKGLDRSSVLQECKQFSAASIDSKKCTATLVKLLYLFGQGDVLSSTEATEIFFGVTKLFQVDNAPALRRVVYVAIKELSTVADQVFVASNTLVKDINSNNDMYRSNAIRALRKITDSSMLGPIERYLKQAAVDKSNNVASAAIVTGLHLSQTTPDLVKRWSSEVNEALKNRGNKVQYHALALLHKLRKSDRLSVLRLVQSVQQGPVKSPLALCLLLKLCTEILQEDFANSQELYNFVVSCLRHSNDCVVFEAARSMVLLRTTTTAKDLSPVILVLQLYLTTHKPILQFTAVRLLSKIASTHPMVVTPCNVDLETLISDSNRNIATLAITTLLKTGQEHSIERLLKQITTFMGDITDDFKIVVVESTKVLCVKYPHKYAILLQFLSEILKAEGGVEFKKTIVEAIILLMDKVPQAKEAGLAHLCDFIQDSEHSTLTSRVVHFLGQVAPTSANPQRCLRHIYSRVLLETPVVRASAVSALAKIGAECQNLRSAAIDLLHQTMQDNDDEVRDRATLYHTVLASGDEVIIRSFISDVATVVRKEKEHAAATTVKPKSYVAEVVEVEVAQKAAAASTAAAAGGGALSSDACSANAAPFRDKLRKVTQLKSLGEPFRTSDPISLTEPDTEYVVKVVKHMYPTHLVLQYGVSNTLEDQALTKVTVKVSTEDLDVKPKFTIPITRIAPGATEYTYILFDKEAAAYPTGAFTNIVSFAMVDNDDTEGAGDVDEYPIDGFDVTIADYLTPKDLGDFAARWEELGSDHETLNTYSLSSIRNLTTAVNQITTFFQLYVAQGSLESSGGKVTTKNHIVALSGAMMTPTGEPTPLLIRAKVFVSADGIVTLELAVRGFSPEIRQFLSDELVGNG